MLMEPVSADFVETNNPGSPCSSDFVWKHNKFMLCVCKCKHSSKITSISSNLAGEADAPQTPGTRIGTDDWTIPETDLIVMNPPWGVQMARADRPFIEAALSTQCAAIHLLHSRGSKHIGGMVRDAGWKYEHVIATTFRLPALYGHHSKRSSDTEVLCWRIHRRGDARLPTEEDQ